MSTKDSVTIKVPRVPDYIRKEKKEVKLHIEEAKKLLSTPLRKAKHENIVKYLNVSYDDFRKEIWVVGIPKIKPGGTKTLSTCKPFSRSESLSTDQIWKH